MEFMEAKQQCLTKWGAIEDSIESATVREFLEDVTEACAFCDIAAERQTLAKEERLPHTGVRCLFCDAYVRYGGCKERIDDLIAAALNEEWDEVREHVRAMIAWLESMQESPDPAVAR